MTHTNAQLHAVAGRWETSGHVIGDPPVPVVGTDVYEVLAGGHFLVHHVDVTLGEHQVQAIEIIGEPDAGGAGGDQDALSFGGYFHFDASPQSEIFTHKK